jgi:hypothetical protein
MDPLLKNLSGGKNGKPTMAAITTALLVTAPVTVDGVGLMVLIGRAGA